MRFSSTLKFLSVLAVGLVAAQAHAGFFPTTTCDDYLGCFNQSMVAGGRIGNVASQQGEDFEVFTAESANGPFAAGETTDHNWANAEPVPFTLTYDATENVVSFDVGNSHTSHVMTATVPPMNTILIRSTAAEWTSVTIENLRLDGIPVDGATFTANGHQTLVLWRDWLEYGFTLTGSATLAFLDMIPPVTGSDLGFTIRVGNDVCPEPAALVLMGLGTLLPGRRRR